MSTLTGEDELIASLSRLQVEATSVSEQWCLEAIKTVQELAQGFVNVDTGALRSSIVTDGPWPVGASGMVEGRVYPTKIYGRRIDLGFHGADSLGRVFNQQGSFYMERAVKEAETIVAALWQEMVGSMIVAAGV